MREEKSNARQTDSAPPARVERIVRRQRPIIDRDRLVRHIPICFFHTDNPFGEYGLSPELVIEASGKTLS